ncbi:MAG: hypothetical protein QXN97_06945 [Desulfurococcaceae archaeon]
MYKFKLRRTLLSIPIRVDKYRDVSTADLKISMPKVLEEIEK